MSAADDVMNGFNAVQSGVETRKKRVFDEKLKQQVNINSLKEPGSTPVYGDESPMQRRFSKMNGAV